MLFLINNMAMELFGLETQISREMCLESNVAKYKIKRMKNVFTPTNCHVCCSNMCVIFGRVSKIAESDYVVGSKSFRPDIQKPRQMENAVRDT